jgi:CHRD domain
MKPVTMLLCLVTLSLAQKTELFKTRLSPVAMDATMRATVAGSGSVSARLTGSRLAIDGSFEGLLSPATIAQVRQSAMTGVRGQVVFDLTVTKATSGTIVGSFELTPEQLTVLGKGRLYVQIHSERAPDGNLWGWLLP